MREEALREILGMHFGTRMLLKRLLGEKVVLGFGEGGKVGLIMELAGMVFLNSNGAFGGSSSYPLLSISFLLG